MLDCARIGDEVISLEVESLSYKSADEESKPDRHGGMVTPNLLRIGSKAEVMVLVTTVTSEAICLGHSVAGCLSDSLSGTAAVPPALRALTQWKQSGEVSTLLA